MKLLVSVSVAVFLGICSAWALSVPDDGAGQTGAGSHAQSVRNPTTLLSNLDVSSIGPIVTEMGYSWETHTTQSGKQFIAANVRSIKMVLLPSACSNGNNSGCLGLQLVAYFDGQRLSPGLVWRYNNDNVFSYIGLENDDAFFVRRYEIADYGIPRGNLEASIQNFRASIDNLRRAFSSAGAGVDATPNLPDTPVGLVQRRVEEAEFLSGNRKIVPSVHAYQELVDDTLFDVLSDPAVPTNQIYERIPADEAADQTAD